MWEVDNRTPFSVDRDWIRDREGADTWVVVVKATFTVGPDGSLEIAAEQPPVHRIPVYDGSAGLESLRYDSDLLPSKPTTDVILLGSAHAPAGMVVESLDAGMRVGPVQKIVKVFGDRRWTATGMSDARPFASMPIVYERAFGGRDARSDDPARDWEWRNPVGCGFAISRANSIGMLIPNVESPGALIQTWSDRPAPAGFGPLCAHWQDRARYAGTYDDAWKRSRFPLPPVDFDDRFHASAPEDQRAPGFLGGGEPVTLVNLSAKGRIQTSVPRVRLGFDTIFYDGSNQVHKQRWLHTILIEPELSRIAVVWHSSIRCHDKPHKLDRTVVTVKEDLRTGEPIGSDDHLEFM